MSKAPKVGTTARTNWYKKFNLALDDTTPGYASNIDSYSDIDLTTVGHGRMHATDMEGNPIEKKSPYKKGIGKYTKKAKGSRGYKMKRK